MAACVSRSQGPQPIGVPAAVPPAELSRLTLHIIRRLPVPLDDKVVAAEQRLAELFATADQIPEAPEFVKWVDRRFNSVLPVSITT